MENTALCADCANCASLCCVAFAFDRSDLFAIDKKSAHPCPNLASCGSCAIYDQRMHLGFSGCIGFDCHGAGQRVTQTWFNGQTWRDDPRLLGPMTQLFTAVYRAHKSLVFLGQIMAFDLTPQDRRRAMALTASITTDAQTGEDFLGLATEADAFLKTLTKYVSRPSRN